MQTKRFVAVLLISVLLVVSVYGAYQFGSSVSYKKGFENGKAFMASQINSPKGPSDSWIEGYNAGLTAQNQTLP